MDMEEGNDEIVLETTVKDVVQNVKSEGLFDNFRKECLESFETMDAYQSLKQRVENHVALFLSKHKYNSSMSKNALRNSLRSHISKSQVLVNGVNRLVDDVLCLKAESFCERIDKQVDHFFRARAEGSKPAVPTTDSSDAASGSSVAQGSNVGTSMGTDQKEIKKEENSSESTEVDMDIEEVEMDIAMPQSDTSSTIETSHTKSTVSDQPPLPDEADSSKQEKSMSSSDKGADVVPQSTKIPSPISSDVKTTGEIEKDKNVIVSTAGGMDSDTGSEPVSSAVCSPYSSVSSLTVDVSPASENRTIPAEVGSKSTAEKICSDSAPEKRVETEEISEVEHVPKNTGKIAQEDVEETTPDSSKKTSKSDLSKTSSTSALESSSRKKVHSSKKTSDGPSHKRSKKIVTLEEMISSVSRDEVRSPTISVRSVSPADEVVPNRRSKSGRTVKARKRYSP